jgi:hypothetical protein
MSIARGVPSVGLRCRCGAETPDEPLTGDGTESEHWREADARCAAKAGANGWRFIDKRWHCSMCAVVATLGQKEVVQA